MTNTTTEAPVRPDAAREALERLSGALGQGDAADQARMADVLTRVADFLQLTPGGTRGSSMPLDFLLDVAVPVNVELGHASMPIGEVLELEPGSVVELDRDISQPVDLVVCGVLFARGEVVVVDDRFAVRIKELATQRSKKGGR